jgi:subtilisin family serine protease
MRKLSLLALLMFFGSSIFSQKEMNTALKARIANRTLPDEFDVLVKADIAKLKSHEDVFQYDFKYNVGDVASIKTDLSALSKLIENKIVTWVEFIEATKQPLNDTMIIRNRIKAINTGQAPLPQAYDGTGVVVGIIDTGTDWRHPDFRTPGGQTRILYMWEQGVPGGTDTPQPYNYGREWTAAQIDASLCPHTDVPGNSHGTHCTGVAAGNGQATGSLTGCAPKADLIIVALNFSYPGPTIADGVNYIFAKAVQLGKPCVINASVGDYMGSHDATDLEAQMIKGMVQNVPGHVMIAAGGNAGVAKYHTKTIPPVNDTVFTWWTNAATTLRYWAYGDTNELKNLKYSIGANRDGTGNWFDFGKIPFKDYKYGIPAVQNDTIKKQNGDRIGIVRTSASVNWAGVVEIYWQIDVDSTSLWWRIETKGTGISHSWQFDMISTSLPTVGQMPRITKYLMPDTMYSIVTGFQCLEDITTVANYCNLNKYYDYNNVLQVAIDNPGGSRVPNSSVGPTRDNRQKPDIGATGSGVFAAACLGLQPSWISGIPNFMAPGGKHVYGSGTSAASPVVAGFAALFLQSNPTLTSKQVRNAIANCAYSDGHTGVSLPNFGWGWGKLDGFASMTCIITGKEEIRLADDVLAYPNPFSEKSKLKFNKEVYGDVFVYSAEGKLLSKDKIAGDTYEVNGKNLSENYKGLLIVRVVSAQGNGVFKLVKTN